MLFPSLTNLSGGGGAICRGSGGDLGLGMKFLCIMDDMYHFPSCEVGEKS